MATLETKTIFTQKSFLIACGAVLLGLTGFWHPWTAEKNSLLEQVASLLFITGGWTVVYDMYLKKDFLSIVENIMRINNDNVNKILKFNEIGLDSIMQDSNHFQYEVFLKRNKNIVIVLNDGRTWISHNEQHIVEKLNSEDCTMTFIVTSKDSEMIDVLARKQSVDRSAIIAKIDEFLESIARINRKSSRKINVFVHKLYNPHSIFLGDEEVIITPYLTSTGRNTVPLYLYKNTGNYSYFRRVKSDVENLMRQGDVTYSVA